MFNAKKIATSIAAAALMMGVSTSAFAAFADMELIRVVYERTTGTTEYATDLGLISNILSASNTTKEGLLPAASNSNNLYVAYFALNRNTNEVWVSGSTNTANAPVMTGGVALNTLKNGTTPMYAYYNSLIADANGTVTGAQSNASSYRTKLSANQGRLGTALNIASGPFTEANLSALATGAATSITQTLYYFKNASLAGSKGVAVGTIITNSNGTTNVTTTPIPAAIYLMGSGLLGLVGVRRRKNA